MRPLKIIALISAAAVSALPVYILLFVSPSFIRLVEENAREESVRAASHLASMLISEDAVLERGTLPGSFAGEAEAVRKDFRVMKIKVYSPAGEVIYSSLRDEIGQKDERGYFTDEVARGHVVSAVVRRATKTLEGELSARDVAETYVPIMRGRRFVGAFEIYCDISDRMESLNRVMTRTYGLLFVIVVCLGAAAFAGVRSAGRSLAERDLARKEWERTFDAVTDPIMILDPHFRMMRVNRAMADFLGSCPDAVIGKTCFSYVHCTDGPIAGCPNSMLLQDGQVHTQEIYEERVGRHYSVSVFPIVDPAGTITATVHYAKDITKRKQAEAALQEREKLLQTIVDTEPECVKLLSGDGSLMMMNAAGLSMIEAESLEEVRGRDISSLVAPEYRDSFRSLFRDVFLGQQGKLEFRITGLKGRQLWVDMQAVPLRNEREEIIALLGITRDITERKRTEHALQQQLRNMTALNDIGIAINSSLDIRIIFNMLLERLISQLGVDAADVLLLDPDTLYLNCAASMGFRTSAVRTVSVRMGKGHAGRAAYERSTIIIRDLGETLTHAFREEEFRAYVAVPLLAHGRTKGVIEVFHRSDLNPSPEWLAFLEVMSAQAAIAIDNAGMFENLQRTNMELTLSYDATLEGWGRTLEFRDEDTMGHTERVAGMAVRFARLLGVEEQSIVHIRRGALLHDVGKISIPDAILLKPGRLEPEEREIMQRHTSYAHQMLSSIPFLRQALDIPYCHHEKWDGSGYPRGLKGEEIPFAARIFSLVDVWDALRSSRPYREAWTTEKVRDYIKARSGTEFDPALVDAFLRMVAEGEQVPAESS